MMPSHFSEIQDHFFQYEDCEEASSNDELRKRKAGLFNTVEMTGSVWRSQEVLNEDFTLTTKSMTYLKQLKQLF